MEIDLTDVVSDNFPDLCNAAVCRIASFRANNRHSPKTIKMTSAQRDLCINWAMLYQYREVYTSDSTFLGLRVVIKTRGTVL